MVAEQLVLLEAVWCFCQLSPLLMGWQDLLCPLRALLCAELHGSMYMCTHMIFSTPPHPPHSTQLSLEVA